MIRKFITAAAFALVAWFATIGPAFAVDVNTASETELQTVKGIGPAISARIVAERKKGNFKDWSDFQSRVNGIGDKTSVTMSQNGLTVGGASKANAPATAAPAKPAAPAAAPTMARTPTPAAAPAPAPTPAPTAAPSTMSKPTPPAPTAAPAPTMAKPATAPAAPAPTMAKPATAPIPPAAPAAAMTKPAAALPSSPSAPMAPATKAEAKVDAKDAKPAKAEAKATGKADALSTSTVDQKPGKKKTEFATDPKKAPEETKVPTKRTNDTTTK